MPFTGPTSYLPTMEEFAAHWEAVNTELAADGPLTLAGGFTLENLQTQHEELDALFTKVQADLNAREIARAIINAEKDKVLARAQEFGRQMRGPYASSPYRQAMPELPNVTAGQEKFLQPMRDVETLWEAVNASQESPLLLSESYAKGDFEAAIQQLSEQYNRYHKADVDLKVVRAQRNALMDTIHTELGGYRPTVEALLPPDSPLVATIPRMTPQPGSTPEPVSIEARWDEAAGEMVVTFGKSTNAKLKEYEVREVIGGDYRDEDEFVLGVIAPEAPRELRSTQNLTQSGSTVSVKVYVLLTTGNEAGSEPVAVTRP